MKKLSRVLSLILALIMVLSLCACGKSAAPVEEPAEEVADEAPVEDILAEGPVAVVDETSAVVDKTTPEGQLIIGYNSEPETLDPAESARGLPTIANFIYEPLIYMDPEQGEMVPWLATDWHYEDDVTLVINLREGVKFSNGNDFTAEDVLYSIGRYAAGSKYGASYTFIDLENCYAEDDYTVVLKFFTPSGPAVNLLTQTYMYDKTFSEEVGIEALNTTSCGTGPYVQVEWTANYAFEYAKNEDYWGGVDVEVFFDSILLRYYSEETTMEVDFETGAIDCAVGVTDTMAERMLDNEIEGANLWLASRMSMYSLALYDQYEPFQDVRVRQAIAHAVNWDDVRDVSLGVLCQAPTSVVPHGLLYKTDVGAYEYDPELAKQLLAEAGYEDGFEFLLVPTTGNFYTLVCETIQYYLAEVGITMNFEQYDFSTAITYWQGTQNNGVPVNQAGILSNGATNGDPDKLMTTTKIGSGLTYVECNDEYVQELLTTGATSADDEVRAQAYSDLQDYMYEQCYQIAFAEEIIAYVGWNYLDNVQTNAPGMPRFCFATIAE